MTRNFSNIFRYDFGAFEFPAAQEPTARRAFAPAGAYGDIGLGTVLKQQEILLAALEVQPSARVSP